MMPLSSKRLLTYLNNSLKSLNYWLIPQICFLCGDAATTLPICSACLVDLPFQGPACIRCARRLQKVGICQHCQKARPHYTHTQAVFSYLYPLDKLILAAKFHHNMAVLNLLGHLMAQHLTIDSRPDVLIPVPLHPKRLRHRGYNQSLELAKRISKHTGIPIAINACQRIINTPPQTSLSGKQRQSNLKGAFKVVRVERHWQHLVLIDDVMTTGATVKELASVFKAAGIEQVDVWCCAKSTTDGM
jgi:ComF family protein